LTVLLTLCGCAVTTLPERPHAAIQGDFRFASTANGGPVSENWWTAFNDPTLNDRVALLSTANLDLAIAVARHDQALAVLAVTRSDTAPSLTAGASLSRARTSATVANRLPTLEAPNIRIPLDLTYEVDLWGRIRHAVAASAAQLAASEATMAAVRLSLTADVVATHLLLRSLQAEERVLAQGIEIRQQAAALAASRFRAGVVSELDSIRAQVELAQAQAELLDLQRREELASDAMAVLLGQQAQSFDKQAVSADTAPWTLPDIPAALPATLLQRRPDIAQASALLDASAESIGVAQASRWPALRLTASAGLASRELQDLLRSPSAIWSFGPSVSVPLLDGGRLDANVRLAQARYQEAVASWRKQVLVALREVQDALAELQLLASRAARLEAAATAAVQAGRVALSRYEKGVGNYADYLDAQRTALAARRAVVQNENSRAAAMVGLCKSLGGGWKPADAERMRAAETTRPPS
jgi:multidrug efflux system outer membrane protein